jgi:hypothetical protein
VIIADCLCDKIDGIITHAKNIAVAVKHQSFAKKLQPCVAKYEIYPIPKNDIRRFIEPYPDYVIE